MVRIGRDPGKVGGESGALQGRGGGRGIASDGRDDSLADWVGATQEAGWVLAGVAQ